MHKSKKPSTIPTKPKPAKSAFAVKAEKAMRRASKAVLQENARYGLPLAGRKVSETSR